VPDLQAALAQAERLGGPTLPPSDLGNVSIAILSDPVGQVIGLVSG
jgi:predicted enzyme related to lactoylglutathione lyase